jgi:hypothetical protein
MTGHIHTAVLRSVVMVLIGMWLILNTVSCLVAVVRHLARTPLPRVIIDRNRFSFGRINYM